MYSLYTIRLGFNQLVDTLSSVTPAIALFLKFWYLSLIQSISIFYGISKILKIVYLVILGDPIHW